MYNLEAAFRIDLIVILKLSFGKTKDSNCFLDSPSLLNSFPWRFHCFFQVIHVLEHILVYRNPLLYLRDLFYMHNKKAYLRVLKRKQAIFFEHLSHFSGRQLQLRHVKNGVCQWICAGWKRSHQVYFRLPNHHQWFEGRPNALHCIGHELQCGRIRDDFATENVLLYCHILPSLGTVCCRLLDLFSSQSWSHSRKDDTVSHHLSRPYQYL